jgi:sarcosine oxidase
MDTYDVIVIGLGAMGGATTYHLAKSGVKVLGFDQYSPPHSFGSSHGDTRITRLAIGEGAEYVPLVKRSHEIWRHIEAQTGLDLLKRTGGLIMSVDGSQAQHGVADFVEQTEKAAIQFGIDHENLSKDQIQSRFPQFNLTNEHGYYEPESGYLLPENCIKAQLRLAVEHGADLNTDERVMSWDSAGEQVTVVTSAGTYVAKKLVISAGSWINDLFPDHGSWFKVYRQVLYWFDIEDKQCYEPLRDMPIYVWVYSTGDAGMIYGFPAIDGPNGGVKIAAEQYVTATSPHEVVREVSEQEIDEMYAQTVEGKFPGIGRECIKAKACMYTVTPDYKFVIDFHPEHNNVIIASPCSGHGFKHSAAIGEVLSQLATTGRSPIDISRFSIQRLEKDDVTAGQ